jgi:flagellar basal-body rod modification protein FlgD
MQTSSITGSTSTTTDRGVGAMKSEDFFKLLITELKQQDPLEPSKTADMIGQVSQIRSIELSKNMTDALTQLSQQQHTTGTSELLGKYITATVKAADGTASELAGIVTGVRFGSEGAVLELDTGQTVLANDVTRVTTAENAPATDPSATGTTATAKSQNAAKTQQSATTQDAGTASGPLPWLSLDAGIHL